MYHNESNITAGDNYNKHMKNERNHNETFDIYGNRHEPTNEHYGRKGKEKQDSRRDIISQHLSETLQDKRRTCTSEEPLLACSALHVPHH